MKRKNSKKSNPIIKAEAVGENRVHFIHRMVLSYTMTFSIVSFLMLGIVFFVLYQSSKRQDELNYNLLVQQPLKLAESYLDDMDNLAYRLMTNEMLISKFRMLKTDGKSGNYFDENVLDYIETASSIASYNRQKEPTWRLSVYNDSGDFISSGAIVEKKHVERILSGHTVSGNMHFFKTGEQDFIVQNTVEDSWSSYFKANYISLVRPLMNIYSHDVVGLVEIQQDIETLARKLKFQTEDNVSLSVDIYTSAGKEVLKQSDEDDVVVSTAFLEKYGWRIELLEPENALWRKNLRLAFILIIVWIMLTLLLFAVIRVVAGRMLNPLIELTRSVNSINPNKLEKIHISDTDIWEVGKLEEAFNHMFDKLNISVEQEKKAFLFAIQSQMNPHFLYNTLSAINAVAIEGNNEKVVEICGNLSSMLRYTASYAEGTATIKEDMAQVKLYLELMKARYDYMFDYEIEMDESCSSFVIPKMIFQPLCENSFAHAFDNIEPPYWLGIRLKASGEAGFIIQVEDNGQGFDDRERERVLEHANKTSYDDMRKMKIGGLGLLSSVVRLKLSTGKKVTCDIVDREGGGSVVKIMVSDEEESL